MKKLILSSLILASLTGATYWLGSAWAQQGAAPKPAAELPHKVGLIDMSHVFKEYKRFESLREEMKEEMLAVDEIQKASIEQAKAIQEELTSGTIKEGSEAYTTREKKLTELRIKLQAQAETSKREFLRRESKIYHSVYTEVEDAVKLFCKHYNYTVILRFSREELKGDDPQKLIQGLQRQVVFFRPEDDITDSVIEYLNRKFQPKPKAAAPATSPTPKPNPGGIAQPPTGTPKR